MASQTKILATTPIHVNARSQIRYPKPYNHPLGHHSEPNPFLRAGFGEQLKLLKRS